MEIQNKQNEDLVALNSKKISSTVILFFVMLQLLTYLTATMVLYSFWGLWSIAILQVSIFFIPVFILSFLLKISFSDWLKVFPFSIKIFLQVSALTLMLIILTSLIMNYFITVPQVKYEEYVQFISSASLLEQLLILAILPAICEEFLFRGFLFGSLEKSLGKITSAVIVTLLFILGHLNEVTVYFVLYYIMLGCLLIFIRLWKKNLLLCIWVHLLNNLIAIVFWSL